jgi:hypothetical protein
MSDQTNETNLQDHDLVTLPGFRCLGAGYDIFGEYASPASIQKQVFDLSPFIADKENDIVAFNHFNYRFPGPKSGLFTFTPIVEHVFQAATGKTIHTFKEDINTSFHGDGILEAFTGSFTISNKKSVYKRSSYAYSMVYCLNKNYKIEVEFGTSKDQEEDKEQVMPYLVDLFKARMDEAQTLQDGLDILKEYGTHVVLKLFVGRQRALYASSSESVYKSTNDFKLLATASCAKVLNVDFKYDDKTAVKDFISNSTTQKKKYGSPDQNVIVGFPEEASLLPIWKVYKNNNECLSNAFDRLTQTYKFIMSLIGRNEQIITGIDFSHDAYKSKKHYRVLHIDGYPADLRKNLGGSYIYMSYKKSSVLEVLQGAQPVTNIIQRTSEHSHPKEIEGYTAIHCDFLQSEDDWHYEFTYYAQIDLSMPSELTDLLALGLGTDYGAIKEQAYAYAADDAKFQLIQDGFQQLQNLEAQENKTYSEVIFSSSDSYSEPQGAADTIVNPESKSYYLDKGYEIISDNLVNEYSDGDYLYIFGKPTQVGA